MIRFSAAIACSLVAFDSAEKALGLKPQYFFPDDIVWLWWVCAVGWLLITFSVVRGDAT
jgi:hypothetical protein